MKKQKERRCEPMLTIIEKCSYKVKSAGHPCCDGGPTLRN